VSAHAADETHRGAWLRNLGSFGGRGSAFITAVAGAVAVAVVTASVANTAAVSTAVVSLATLITAGFRASVLVPRTIVFPEGAIILGVDVGRRKSAVCCDMLRVEATVVARRAIIIVIGVGRKPLLVPDGLVGETPGLLDCIDAKFMVVRGRCEWCRRQNLEASLDLARSCRREMGRSRID
jgi:hypothetical protein